MMHTITHTQPHTFVFRGAALLRGRRLGTGLAC